MIGKIIVNGLLVLSAAYIIYAAFYLKKGFPEKIKALPEGTKVPSDENIAAFIRFMFPVTLVVGILGAICAICNIVDDITGLLLGIPYYMILVYMVGIVTYAFLSSYARNKYLVI